MQSVFKGLSVYIDEIEFNSDPVDCMALSAHYVVTGVPLTEEELVDLDFTVDYTASWHMHQIEKAEYFADWER